MPKSGFSSFTVRDECANKIHSDYERKKKSLKLNGINNFSDYLVYLSESQRTTDLDDIKELLLITNQSFHIMIDMMLGVDRGICEENHLRSKQHTMKFILDFKND